MVVSGLAGSMARTPRAEFTVGSTSKFLAQTGTTSPFIELSVRLVNAGGVFELPVAGHERE